MTSQTGQHPREATRIQCLECGRWFRALPRHLRVTHGYSDEDYRLKYRIAIGSPLVCIEWSERLRASAIERDLAALGSHNGPPKGFKQRQSALSLRRDHYQKLAESGQAALQGIDKTELRRAKIAPYPVTAEQVAERLDVTMSAAYNFLSFCVKTGRLIRVGHGLYDAIPEPPTKDAQ